MRRGGKQPVNSQGTISPAIGDDTIEIELTPDEWLNLSQAAEAAEAADAAAETADAAQRVAHAQIPPSAQSGQMSAAYASPQPLFEDSASGRFRRWHQAPVAKMAGAIIAYTAFAWWSASQLAGQPQQPAVAVARPAVVVPPPALVISSPKPAVRVINPFDATEVFEFPAGTSHAEDREKVAQMLLQRARARQGQWEHIKPVVTLRTASLYRSP
jgi:hypothetical protein